MSSEVYGSEARANTTGLKVNYKLPLSSLAFQDLSAPINGQLCCSHKLNGCWIHRSKISELDKKKVVLN